MTAWHQRPLHFAVIVALGTLVTTGLLGATMGAPLDRDESMYVSAGVMARSHALYVDVPFLQMPALPWVYAAILPVPGEGPLLLVARLSTFLCGVFTLIAVAGVAVRRGASPLVATALAALLAAHPTFLAAIGQAANHLPPLAACAGAAWLLAGATTPSRRAALVAGVLLGAAVAFRATWLVVVVTAAATTFALPPLRPRARWIGAGIVLALLPVAVAASADPGAFLFQNLGYHEITRQWAIDGGLPWRLGRRALLEGCIDFARTPGGALWIAGIALSAAAGLRTHSRPRPVLAALVVLAAAGLASALPSPWWPRHALPLVGVATLLAASCLPARATTGRLPSALAATLVLGALVVPGAPTRSLDVTFGPSRWVPRTLHANARDLAGAPSPVVSLSPLHALEAGIAIDPATVTGPFLVRVRDRLRDGTPDAGGASILELEPAPPAVIAGVEPRYEDDLVQRLRVRSYRPGATTHDGATLWVLDTE